MSVKYITKDQAKSLILSSKGKFFTVEFVKKDGSLRVLTGRTGVTKYITGEGMKYNPKDYNLIPTFEIKTDNYRAVSVDRLTKLNINKEKYEVI